MTAAPTRLSDEDVATALRALPGWSVVEGKLRREFRFTDFIEAWGFMARAALVVQAMDHHPEWFNVYGTVRVDLTTHSAGGISERDVELARVMSALATV